MSARHRLRSPVLGLLLAGAAALGACATHVEEASSSGTSGGVTGGGTMGTTTSTTGGSSTTGTTTDSGGTCPPPPPPSTTPPLGCAEGSGNGWVSVPCICDLWIQNTETTAGTATISLTLAQNVSPPPLDGMFSVEIAFDDADESWYAAWASQPENGSVYSVAAAGGTTTLRMGANSVSLAPVPVAGCTTRKGTAKVFLTNLYPSPNYGTTLTMSASLAIDGTNITTINPPVCSNPPPV